MTRPALPEIRQFVRELGAKSRVAATLGGPPLYWSARHEGPRYPSGRRLEPRIFVERPA